MSDTPTAAPPSSPSSGSAPALGALAHIATHLIDVPTTQRIRLELDRDDLAELADSIRAIGVLNPITVRRQGARFELIAGFRRLAATRTVDLPTIPANVLDVDDATARAMTLTENAHRAQLTPMEEANAIRDLLQLHADDMESAALVLGRPATWCYERLELLNIPQPLQAALHAGTLSIAAARSLAAITDAALRAHYVDAAVRHGCSARLAAQWLEQAEAHIQAIASNDPADPTPPPPEITYVTQALCHACGTHHPINEVRALAFCAKCLGDLAAARKRA